jgi:hypothetical protein
LFDFQRKQGFTAGNALKGGVKLRPHARLKLIGDGGQHSLCGIVSVINPLLKPCKASGA